MNIGFMAIHSLPFHMYIRGGSRTAATSKMERFVIIVNGAVNYYHKALHLGCCSSPRSVSVHIPYHEQQKKQFIHSFILSFIHCFFMCTFYMSNRKQIQPNAANIVLIRNRFMTISCYNLLKLSPYQYFFKQQAE